MSYLDVKLKDLKYYGTEPDSNAIQHFGILGMKWGIRRYQNPDGTLTDEGKKRYAKQEENYKKEYKEYTKLLKEKRPNNFLNNLTDPRRVRDRFKINKNGEREYVPRDLFTGTDRMTLKALRTRAKRKAQEARDYLDLDSSVRRKLKNNKSKYD